MFRGAELTRLMTGIVMLAVLYMLITRAGDPGMWRWLSGNRNDVVAAKASEPKTPPPPLPPASGPTDEDPEQVEAVQEEFQAITDGALNMGPEEMEAYDRLIEWVQNQSFARLSRRAKKGLWYTDLYDDAERRRGALVELKLDVCLAHDVGKSRAGVDLHEVLGKTEESRGRLYDLIVVDYPKGMPVGYDIREKAEFAGYFLKVQGYHPARAKPGEAPEKAPVLIGRLQWTPAPPPPTDNTTQEWTWGLALLLVIGVAAVVRLVYSKLAPRRPTARAAMPTAAPGEVIPIEAWLERAGFNASDGGDEENEHIDGNGAQRECDIT